MTIFDNDDTGFTVDDLSFGDDMINHDLNHDDTSQYLNSQHEDESLLGSHVLGGGLDKEYYTQQLQHEQEQYDYYNGKYIDSLDEDSDYWTNYYKDQMEISQDYIDKYKRELE